MGQARGAVSTVDSGDVLDLAGLQETGGFICHMDLCPINAHNHMESRVLAPVIVNRDESAGSKPIFDECVEHVLAILDVLRAELLHRCL